MKILLIEDDRDVRELVKASISFQWPSSKVFEASEGGKGLSAAKIERPDLVILDIGLPDIHGLVVLRRLREFTDVPTIVLTGTEPGDSSAALFLKEGADDYIVKPPSQIELLARIEAVLRRDPQRKHLIDQTSAAPESASDTRPAPLGAEAHTQGDVVETGEQPPDIEDTYEGAVKLIVHGANAVAAVSDFIRQVRDVPGLRVSRLNHNQLGGTDILLRLRQPMNVRAILTRMSGVASVSPSPVRYQVPEGDAPTVMVMLTPGGVPGRPTQA